MSQTYHIPFTRFTPPNGRQSEDSMITTDPEVAAAYERIAAAGFRMTVELLGPMVSACIECPDGDYDSVVKANGPGLPEAVGEMMKRFDPAEAEAWRRGAVGLEDDEGTLSDPHEES